MINQSKIGIWYRVSGQGILLGERYSTRKEDVISLWVNYPFDTKSSRYEGYRISLYDDDGRCIAEKRVTQNDAETLLMQNSCDELKMTINELSYPAINSLASSSLWPRIRIGDDQADFAPI